MCVYSSNIFTEKCTTIVNRSVEGETHKTGCNSTWSGDLQ